MPKATLSGGLTLHYQRVGKGPDLVMIHGLTGNLAVWHFKILPLLKDRFRILTYDLRGHGFSGMPPTGYSATDMAGDLLGLLDVLGIEHAALVGHSFGADVAINFAFHCPDRVRQVVAIEPGLPMVDDTRGLGWEGWSLWVDALERSGRAVPLEHRHDADYLIRESLKVPKKWGPLNGLPRNPEPFLRLLDTTTVVEDYPKAGDLTLDGLAGIRTPIHLVSVERSAFVETYRTLIDRVPGVTSSVLPRTEWGHFGPLEQPESVVAILNAVLNADPLEVAQSGSFVPSPGGC